MSKLKQWRNKMGWSQKDLADAIGVRTDSVISKYEAGSQRPRLETAKRIEAATNGEVTAAELLGLTAKPKDHGVSEDPVTFEREAKISIAIPAGLLAQCRLQGLDIEAELIKNGIPGLREAFKQVWYEANRAAIDTNRKHTETHGTFAERRGVFPPR